MIIRKAGIGDVDLLVRLRLDFLGGDNGNLSKTDAEKIERQLREYLPAHIADGTFIAYIGEISDEAVSTAYLAVCEKPANPAFPNGIVGTMLNVMTYPSYRRMGYATGVITALLNEAKLIGVSMVELSATEDGKELYTKMGFHVSSHTAMNFFIK